MRLLYHIKKELGIGSVTKDNTKGQFFIRDRKKLNEIIFPIFDKYPLLTSKYFSYLCFKKAYLILISNIYTDTQKNAEIEKLLRCGLPSIGVSPKISHLNPDS